VLTRRKGGLCVELSYPADVSRHRHVRDPRVVARCVVAFERLDRRVVAESEDLSRRGLFVRTDELLPVGAIIDLELTLPNNARFEVSARVAHLLAPSSARALGRHVGMGLELVDRGDGGLAALTDHLDELIHALAPPPVVMPGQFAALVVEPSAPLRTRISSALDAAGFVVRAWASGAEALRTAVAHLPDVVVAATTMPGVEGLGFLRALAQTPALASAPVVVTADDSSDLLRLEAFRLGASDYITKPFLDEELVIRVRRVALGAARSSERESTLRGTLREISLATLLSLLEFERKSGLALVHAPGHLARLFVAGGRIVRVEADGLDDDPVAAMMAMLDWKHGRFEFIACEVAGSDEIGMPTQQLLLEHARLRDEAARPLD
jgi:CheY-like chemotaxis protein/Tfp pilus assembly protein PilZ